jgi:hypothetical protein
VHLQEIADADTRVLRLGAWHGEDGRPTVIVLSAGSTDPNAMSVFAERVVTFPPALIPQLRAALAALEERQGGELAKLWCPVRAP